MQKTKVLPKFTSSKTVIQIHVFAKRFYSHILTFRRLAAIANFKNFTREYLRYVGRRSVVVDHLFSVKLQGRGLAYAAGAPARGAPLAWGRSFGETLFF